MNGRDMLTFGTKAIGGIDPSDEFYFFDCLNKAAVDFVRQTRCLTTAVDITTVEDQQAYDLPADFINLHTKTKKKRYLFGRFVDADDKTTYPKATSEEKIREYDLTDAKSPPALFAILPAVSVPDPVTGTVTTAPAASGGLQRITDAAGDFSGVSAGDRIGNGTDGSSGVVVRKISGTVLDVAIFGGTNGYFEVDDAYTINPGPKMRVVLDAPSLTADETLRLWYVRKPEPVYHDAGMWAIDPQSCRPIAYEGAYLYMQDYDFDPDRDGHLHLHYLDEISRLKRERAAEILQGGRYRYRS